MGEQVRFDDIKTMIGNMDALAEIAAPARPTGPIRFLDGMAPALHLQNRATRGGLVRGAIALASGERGVDTGLAHEVDCETRRRNPGRKFEGAVAISLKALISEPVQKADIGALPGGLAEIGRAHV